jgi:Amt family ammonium transporter
MVLMYAVKATGTLRVSKEGEIEGLDLHEHGGTAYPEITVGSSHAPVSSSMSGSASPAAAE